MQSAKLNKDNAVCLLLIAVFLNGGLCQPAAAQQAVQVRVVGHIDGLRVDGNGCHVWGWACQQGNPESLEIHLYAGASAYGSNKGTFVMAAKANLDNEPAVDRVCRCGQGQRHRFDVTLPDAVLAKFHGQPLYVHGIHVAGAVANAAIDGSGKVSIPDAAEQRTEPASYPRLSGSYLSRADHPRVFVTEDELNEMAAKINIAGSYSAKRFGELAARIKSDLAANVDFDEAYSGCDMEIYLRGFSYEPKPAYGNDRSDGVLASAMHVHAGAKPLHGGAVVASRMALYAALVKAGAAMPADAPDPDQAIATAKRILLSWADHGFRDEHGNFRRNESQYCDLDMNGKQIVTQYGKFVGALTLSRGVVYSVHAQDLLQGMHALTPQEEKHLDTFHREMFDTIRSINNQEFDVNMKWKYYDEVYNNQFVGHLTCLLAIARLFDDKDKMDAVLYGGEGNDVLIPSWVSLFDHVIYGPSDKPLRHITPNKSADPLLSHPAYSTPVVAAGEINDRYRNLNPLQAIGYAMGSLQGLYMAAEALRIAGFGPYSYRGAHDQSIEMATRYYACYAKHAGFGKTITAENCPTCPDVHQYIGKIVNGVDSNILIGALRFPNDKAIVEVEDGARASASAQHFTVDSILFGKWRN